MRNVNRAARRDLVAFLAEVHRTIRQADEWIHTVEEIGNCGLDKSLFQKARWVPGSRYSMHSENLRQTNRTGTWDTDPAPWYVAFDTLLGQYEIKPSTALGTLGL
ncbi:hypothetical protein PENSTE_c006G08170 [Penicillium steckii]|uniref:Uncharacterized protein n=1 Tax=Penicillium steckii TaxID=303698 RepID=A0A1V6TGP9_9EURO|nr:hypothetical protein PENSTE_c006G08170 [Penicillium steckii]